MTPIRAALRALAWIVMLAAVAAIAVAVVVPRLGGATPYTVLTGSMEPGLPPGTLVVARPVDPAELGVGDVVTYQLESGRAAVVTHRIVAQGVRPDGEAVFQTQGDANDVVDQEWVRGVQVRGRLWYSVPVLGRLNTLLTGAQHQVVAYVVGGSLAAYAAFMLVSAATDRRRGRRSVRMDA